MAIVHSSISSEKSSADAFGALAFFPADLRAFLATAPSSAVDPSTPTASAARSPTAASLSVTTGSLSSSSALSFGVKETFFLTVVFFEVLPAGFLAAFF
jgi:hypothetical protein